MNIFTFNFFLIQIVISSSSFLSFSEIKRYTRNINGISVKVYEPKDIIKKETHSILFYTGGNAAITSEIYTNFLYNLANKGFSIYISPFEISKNEEIFETINMEYLDVTNLAHSSGAIPALKSANVNKEIKKTILLDPVNSEQLTNILTPNFFPFFQKKEKSNVKFKYISDLLILNAKKSYEWKIFPLSIPFIPAFKMNPKNIVKDNVNVKIIEASDFGHSDILNPIWADIMHNTISKGSKNRDESLLENYHSWLTTKIFNFINNSSNINTKFLNNFEYPSNYEDINV